MTKETTEAWILRLGKRRDPKPGTLELSTIDLPELSDHDVLAEPIFGSWEANMTHALERKPADICLLRREREVVLGNSGVVRVLKTGSAVTLCQENDLCGLAPVGTEDPLGHTIKVLGYDAPHTMGLLAKRVVVNERQMVPLPNPTRYSYQQWAGFPIRYATAWDNWRLTYGIWRQLFEDGEHPIPFVWGWGGGVALAELELAKYDGCQVAMTASTDERLQLLKELGITPIDRRPFRELDFDETHYDSDPDYKANYLRAEKAFLDAVAQHTNGAGVSIFIDNIGAPVFRATQLALGRLGVITTSGWKHGKRLAYDRVGACVGRQMFVHSHGCSRQGGVNAAAFGEKHGWMPPAGAEEYAWEEIPRLAADYAAGKIRSYFPVYHVNVL